MKKLTLMFSAITLGILFLLPQSNRSTTNYFSSKPSQFTSISNSVDNQLNIHVEEDANRNIFSYGNEKKAIHIVDGCRDALTGGRRNVASDIDDGYRDIFTYGGGMRTIHIVDGCRDALTGGRRNVASDIDDDYRDIFTYNGGMGTIHIVDGCRDAFTGGRRNVASDIDDGYRDIVCTLRFHRTS